MEETVRTTADAYDFRRHDRLWQRVGPALEPYPSAGTPDREVPAPSQAAAGDGGGSIPLTMAQAAALPGAERDPCCMGTEAAELLAVLEGYIQEELEDRRRYLALMRQAPAWARQTLRQMAQDEGGHARRLMAVRYLITGQSVRPQQPCGPVYFGSWPEELRRSYHQEACGALNYARSADSTPDLCLAALLKELSADEYRHAQTLLEMLERGLERSTCL